MASLSIKQLAAKVAEGDFASAIALVQAGDADTISQAVALYSPTRRVTAATFDLLCDALEVKHRQDVMSELRKAVEK